MGKFTKTKGRCEKQGITPQRVRVFVKEKVLFQDSPSEGNSWLCRNSWGKMGKGEQNDWNWSLQGLMTTERSRSYFLPTAFSFLLSTNNQGCVSRWAAVESSLSVSRFLIYVNEGLSRSRHWPVISHTEVQRQCFLKRCLQGNFILKYQSRGALVLFPSFWFSQ